MPANEHLARGRLFQPGQLVQQGGFAAAGLADNTAEFPLFYGQVNIVQRDDTLLADGVDLAQLFCMDNGRQYHTPFLIGISCIIPYGEERKKRGKL